jgi:EAL domain-containing protein (putative c-di-GMP-specific phosphodiesterase class I)
MPEIGAWVLREACQQMHEWLPVQWRPFRLAVNVSARQVGPGFDDQVQQALAAAGLLAEHLEIELTESAAFGDPAIRAKRAMRWPAPCFSTGWVKSATAVSSSSATGPAAST